MFLLFDILLIVQGVLYFSCSLNISEQKDSESVDKMLVYTSVCLVPVYITLVAVKFYYILKAHPKMKLALLKMLPECLRKKSKILVKPSFPKKDDDSAFKLSTHPPKVLHYADLREPLLDDPEVSDKPLSIVCDD